MKGAKGKAMLDLWCGRWKFESRSVCRMMTKKLSRRMEIAMTGAEGKAMLSLYLWCVRWQFESRSRCRMRTKNSGDAWKSLSNLNLCIGEGYLNLDIGEGSEGKAMLESRFVVIDGNLNL